MAKYLNRTTGDIVDAYKLGDDDFPQRNVQFPPCGPQKGFYYVVGKDPEKPGYGSCSVVQAKVFEAENEPYTGGPINVVKPKPEPEPEPAPEPPTKPAGE